MTDKQRTIEFLESLGLKESDTYVEGYVIFDKSIDLTPYLPPYPPGKELIIGDSWASVSFHFDDNGNFVNIEIIGD